MKRYPPGRIALALLVASCERHGSVMVHTVIDAGTVSQCVVAYGCWMSHPGLGTW